MTDNSGTLCISGAIMDNETLPELISQSKTLPNISQLIVAALVLLLVWRSRALGAVYSRHASPIVREG